MSHFEGPDPRAMTPRELSRLLTSAGKRSITAEHIEKDIADGAPTNGDGSLNLIHYAAWLAARSTD